MTKSANSTTPASTDIKGSDLSTMGGNSNDPWFQGTNTPSPSDVTGSDPSLADTTNRLKDIPPELRDKVVVSYLDLQSLSRYVRTSRQAFQEHGPEVYSFPTPERIASEVFKRAEEEKSRSVTNGIEENYHQRCVEKLSVIVGDQSSYKEYQTHRLKRYLEAFRHFEWYSNRKSGLVLSMAAELDDPITGSRLHSTVSNVFNNNGKSEPVFENNDSNLFLSPSHSQLSMYGFDPLYSRDRQPLDPMTTWRLVDEVATTDPLPFNVQLAQFHSFDNGMPYVHNPDINHSFFEQSVISSQNWKLDHIGDLDDQRTSHLYPYLKELSLASGNYTNTIESVLKNRVFKRPLDLRLTALYRDPKDKELMPPTVFEVLGDSDLWTALSKNPSIKSVTIEVSDLQVGPVEMKELNANLELPKNLDNILFYRHFPLEWVAKATEDPVPVMTSDTCPNVRFRSIPARSLCRV